MNKDLESLSEIERLLEELSEKERERIVEWLYDKYMPEEDEALAQDWSGNVITYWPNYDYTIPTMPSPYTQPIEPLDPYTTII